MLSNFDKRETAKKLPTLWSKSSVFWSLTVRACLYVEIVNISLGREEPLNFDGSFLPRGKVFG
jgi:hypothetical protein